MTDTGPDIQPTPLIPDHPKEIQRQHVTNGHDHHEQTTRRYTQPAVQNPQVGGDEGEGDEEFEQE